MTTIVSSGVVMMKKCGVNEAMEHDGDIVLVGNLEW